MAKSLMVGRHQDSAVCFWRFAGTVVAFAVSSVLGIVN